MSDLRWNGDTLRWEPTDAFTLRAAIEMRRLSVKEYGEALMANASKDRVSLLSERCRQTDAELTRLTVACVSPKKEP